MIGEIIGAVANVASARRKERKDREMLDYQNWYNSPAQQMGRYKDAGLNPHLIYGQGSPGNQSSPQEAVDAKPGDSLRGMNIGGMILDALRLQKDMVLAQSQVAAQAAQIRRTEEDIKRIGMDTQLKEVMTRRSESDIELNSAKREMLRVEKLIAEGNPYLRSSYVQAIIDRAMSEAETAGNVATTSYLNRARMEAELKNLAQKYRIGEQDLRIKAKIFESKDFQNDLLKIERDFMQSGDISWGHWLTALKSLLLNFAK